MSKNLLNITTRFQVPFRDCDPLKIVWHGNYFKYFEDAREKFCENYGISYRDVMALGYATPIVKSICEHKLPLRFGDKFVVETTFRPTAAAKMVFEYKLFMEEKLICKGETVQVFLDEKGELVLQNPPFFLEWKKKMNIDY